MMVVLLMLLSGDVLFLLSFAFKHMWKNALTALQYVRLLKMSLLFHFIPLKLAADFVYTAVACAFPEQLSAEMINHQDGFVMLFRDEVFLSKVIQEHIVVFLFFFGVSIVLMIRRIRKLYLFCPNFLGERENAGIESEKRDEMGVHRVVRIYWTERNVSPFTYGLLRPCIVLPKWLKLDQKKLSFVLKHEFMHIKRLDFFFVVLGVVGKTIFFWDPFVHWLVYEYRRNCELACDETVIHGLNYNDRKDYAELIIQCSTKTGLSTENIISMSRSGEQIQERISKVMKSKKAHCRIGGVIGMALLLGSAMPEIAASRTEVVFPSNKESYALIAGLPEHAEILFAGKHESGLKRMLYFDNAFVDKQGNMYKLSQSAQGVCKHEYVKGEQVQHAKGRASCTVTTFEAYRCVKCAQTLKRKRIKTEYHEKCLHEIKKDIVAS